MINQYLAHMITCFYWTADDYTRTVNMKKHIKSAIALFSALAMLSCGALSASAGNLTEEQLIDKYGYRCEISFQPGLVSGADWAAIERKDAGANISETIASGVKNGLCYDELADGSVSITGVDFDTFSADATILTIPEEISGKPVKVIGSHAFQRLYQALPELASPPSASADPVPLYWALRDPHSAWAR